MQVTILPLEKIVPYARNPRKNAGAVATIKASLQEFGWKQPIVVDEQHVILAGHTRYLAARELGWTTAPVHIAKDLTPAQAKAYRIMDNKSHERAEWDDELLRLEFADLKDMDLDLDLTGFNADELESLLAIVPDEPETNEGEDTEAQEDRIGELLAKWGVVRGDLWLCGDHRLLCGDSTSADDVSRLLDGAVPKLMATDPPYGVKYEASWRKEALPKTNPGKSGGMHGKVANDDRADWSEALALFPGDVAYVWHASLYSHVIAKSILDCGFDLISQIVWVKNQFIIGRGDYHWHHETAYYAVRKGARHGFTDDRTQSTVWTIAKSTSNDTGHSTQKPLECMERPIRNHPDMDVYDPFLGSGTTLIAAHNLRRRCHAMEIEPGYIAVALQRFLDHTGIRPQRAP